MGVEAGSAYVAGCFRGACSKGASLIIGDLSSTGIDSWVWAWIPWLISTARVAVRTEAQDFIA
jgi:hypothetical protein